MLIDTVRVNTGVNLDFRINQCQQVKPVEYKNI